MKSKQSLLILMIFQCGIIFSLLWTLPMTIASEIKTQEDLDIELGSSFKFIELSTKIGGEEDISSISLSLPSDKWNITDLQMNFTDIKLGRELKTIEDLDVGTADTLYYQNVATKLLGSAVQVNISETTELYGVYIKAKLISGTINNFRFQIQGYNDGQNTANGVPLYDIPLNISTDLEWYYQNFTSLGVNLAQGNYSLVINGSLLQTNNDKTSKCSWSYNSIEPTTPYLHKSLNTGTWNPGTINSTYLYKLDQKTDDDYNPTHINMTAELNGNIYDIKDTPSPGTGNLTIKAINFNPGTKILNIPIYINRTIELSFNINYSLSLRNIFYSAAELTIPEKGDNEWSLYPEISRCNCNYTVEFEAPESWTSLKVLRNGADVTATTSFSSGILTIPNSTITIGSSWKITAESEQLDFKLDVAEDKYEPLEELKFTVDPPRESGNLTFLLIDALNTEELEEQEEVDSDKITFAYDFGEKPHEGKWKIYVFWNDDTDAGVQTAEIEVEVPFTIPFEVLMMTIVLGIVGVVAGITTYTMVKRAKQKKRERRQNIYNKYMDALNLGQIIITEKKSGLDIYQQQFAGKEMDATLISGFLDAIRSFGLELTSSEDQTQTIKLDFKGSRVLMTEFKNFRIISVMLETPSHLFVESINDLSKDIDAHYGSSLDKFKGSRAEFAGILQLLEKHLLVSLLYPLNVVKLEDVKVSSDEKSIIGRARKMMKEKGTEYFFVASLLKKGFQVDDAEIILSLIKKKVFQPIYPVA